MNLDLSIQRMAAQESDSLVNRQALIARKRAELELQLAANREAQPEATKGAIIEDAVTTLEMQSSQFVSDSGRLIDKRV